MAAILGLELQAVEQVAREASEVGVCDLANDNAPGQAVVSGSRDAVERAVDLAKAQGARRSVLLPVSAPFHCRLLAPAAEAVRAALADVRIGAPAVPVVSNVTASPESAPEVLRARLVEQVTARVRWRESLLAMAELGVEAIVELGAGRVLSGLAKRAMPGLATVALGTPGEIDAFVATLGS
jgi:[acyl-carrier-protein] S-malonyltransferase